jgi:sorbitol-specific phosphotransferase system component IIBC
MTTGIRSLAPDHEKEVLYVETILESGKVVKVSKGQGGWGGPFLLQETETLKIVASITRGGIHPVAKKIADYLGVQAVDGFSSKVDPSQMICAVIDCDGTARCGVYPKFGIKTVDIIASSPSGPLSKYMKEENFVSGVTVNDVSIADGSASVVVPFVAPASDGKKAEVKLEYNYETKEQNNVCCPRCGSSQITAKTKGFGLGKAVVGGFLLGPIGLLGGTIGSNKTLVVCLKCGHQWGI